MEPIISPIARCLLVVAAPRELGAVLEGFETAIHELPGSQAQSQTQPELGIPIRLDVCFDAIRAGVGKSSCSAATARAIVLGDYRSVISIGIAGSLPCEHPISIGQTISATRSVFSDEGVGATSGFIPLSELGFAPFADNQMGMDHDPDLSTMLASITDTQGVIATVSWCSGDEPCARGVVARTGAVAEAMEGAAACVACQMIDPTIRTGELRVISNTTGTRENQVWDLDGALAALTALSGRLRVLGREH